MQIRRVKTYDGGNHLINDEIQYREKIGDQWATVQVLTSSEAFIADIREGLVDLDNLDMTPSLKQYWRDKADEA